MITVAQATWRWTPPKPDRDLTPGLTCQKANGSCLETSEEARSAQPHWATRPVRGPRMTHNYLIAELSVRLGELQATAAHDTAPELTALRYQVEAGSPLGLRDAAAQALALADRLCWQSLSRGDIAAFARQAEVSADLHLFGVCSRLLADS